MLLVVVKHAGVVIDVYVTEFPNTWIETEGKRIREQFPSARFEFQELGCSEPTAPKPTGKRTKAE